MTEVIEEWRDVVGYECFYEVSNHGRIRSLDRKVISYGKSNFVGTRIQKGKILKPTRLNRGKKHLYLRLTDINGVKKGHLLHRLVLEAFVGPCPEGMECRHYPDRDVTNNCVWNLRWGTRQENAEDKIRDGMSNGCTGAVDGEKNGRAKLTWDNVLDARRLYATKRYTYARLANNYGVGINTIRSVIIGETWRD